MNIAAKTALIIALVVGVGIGNYYNFEASAESNPYVGRVAIDTSTGKIIEFQSGLAPLGALTQNAINAGYDQGNIQEGYINASDYQTYLISIQPPTKTLIQKARDGDRAALRQVIDSVGGYDALTAAQKTKVIKLMLGYNETLP